MSIRDLLGAVEARLRPVFGDRLKGIVLYGSEARGHASPTSDIDLLVLLSGPLSFGAELRKVTSALYSLQLEMPDRPIHAIPVDAADFEGGGSALFRAARAEGVIA